MEEIAENTVPRVISPPRLYTYSLAAKRLGMNYQKLFYAVAKGWITPYQEKPVVLIEEEELFRYANKNNIEIPVTSEG